MGVVAWMRLRGHLRMYRQREMKCRIRAWKEPRKDQASATVALRF